MREITGIGEIPITQVQVTIKKCRESENEWLYMIPTAKKGFVLNALSDNRMIYIILCAQKIFSRAFILSVYVLTIKTRNIKYGNLNLYIKIRNIKYCTPGAYKKKLLYSNSRFFCSTSGQAVYMQTALLQ